MITYSYSECKYDQWSAPLRASLTQRIDIRSRQILNLHILSAWVVVGAVVSPGKTYIFKPNYTHVGLYVQIHTDEICNLVTGGALDA